MNQHTGITNRFRFLAKNKNVKNKTDAWVFSEISPPLVVVPAKQAGDRRTFDVNCCRHFSHKPCVVQFTTLSAGQPTFGKRFNTFASMLLQCTTPRSTGSSALPQHQGPQTPPPALRTSWPYAPRRALFPGHRLLSPSHAAPSAPASKATGDATTSGGSVT